MNARAAICRAALTAAAALAAARGAAAAPADGTETFDRSHGKVALRVKAAPAAVDPMRTFFVEIETTVPSGTALELPRLDMFRFDGFEVLGRYTDDTDDDGATARVSRRFRLLPDPAAARYRLAPFAVSAALPDGTQLDFAVQAAVFRRAAPRKPAEAAARTFAPVPPEDGAADAALAAAAALAAGLAVFAAAFFPVRMLVRAAGKIGRSAAQRAYDELDELQNADLPAKGLHKEHFARLTSIVRKYVESAYVKSSSEKINASKMTTEEFLRSAEGSPYFPEKALAMLRGFLQDADRVKFAGARTTREKSYDASATARGYVESDARDRAAMAAAERAKKGRTGA